MIPELEDLFALYDTKVGQSPTPPAGYKKVPLQETSGPVSGLITDAEAAWHRLIFDPGRAQEVVWLGGTLQRYAPKVGGSASLKFQKKT